MRIKFIVAVLPITLLTACSTTQTPQPFIPAQPLIEKPLVLKPGSSKENYQLQTGNDPALEKAFQHYLKTGKATNIITDGFITFAYNQGQQPIVHTTPFQATVISLEKGERFTNVTSGDPDRWSYSVALSGQSGLQQQHILVKPSGSELSTNLVITTDRRIYNLNIVATTKETLTRQVRFWYPEEQVNFINQENLKKSIEAPIASLTQVNLSGLNFNYRIAGGGLFSKPSWAPTRVFDDGTHTYIQFPLSVNSRDLPALFIQNGNTQELVNYRAKAPYFVVDKIFKQAVLISGVGRQKEKVTLINLHY